MLYLTTDKPVIISACLIGVNCRYDGGNAMLQEMTECPNDSLAPHFFPLCPEQIGGLSTPRSPAEILGGSGEDVLQGMASVVDVDGQDLTEKFIIGAQEVLKVAKLLGIRDIILKDKSPSCGVSVIYRDGLLVEGNGVTTALLIREGMNIEAMG